MPFFWASSIYLFPERGDLEVNTGGKDEKTQQDFR